MDHDQNSRLRGGLILGLVRVLVRYDIYQESLIGCKSLEEYLIEVFTEV